MGKITVTSIYKREGLPADQNKKCANWFKHLLKGSQFGGSLST